MVGNTWKINRCSCSSTDIHTIKSVSRLISFLLLVEFVLWSIVTSLIVYNVIFFLLGFLFFIFVFNFKFEFLRAFLFLFVSVYFLSFWRMVAEDHSFFIAEIVFWIDQWYWQGLVVVKKRYFIQVLLLKFYLGLEIIADWSNLVSYLFKFLSGVFF